MLYEVITIGFQGDIAAIALDNIFQLFDFAALSGKLEIRTLENDGIFYFTGRITSYNVCYTKLLRSGLGSTSRLM